MLTLIYITQLPVDFSGSGYYSVGRAVASDISEVRGSNPVIAKIYNERVYCEQLRRRREKKEDLSQ